VLPLLVENFGECKIFELRCRFSTKSYPMSVHLQRCTVVMLLLSFARDFLPRGSGIVTRRPLVLQLMTSRNGGMSRFLSMRGSRRTNQVAENKMRFFKESKASPNFTRRTSKVQ